MNPEKKPHHSFWYAFNMYPKIRIESQDDSEEIVLLLRAHPITQLGWFFNTIGLIIILFLLNLFIFPFLTLNQVFFVNIFSIAFLFAYVVFNFLVWYFNVGIVTNLRIIDVDSHSLTYKEVSETRINSVEDVTSKSGGFFPSIFDYGNVFAQTAGTYVNIEFLNVPRPSEVVRVINSLLRP